MDKNSIKPLEDLIDGVRNIDGFPLGNLKDIIGLSDPPFYTACPNPYLKQFIEEYGKPYNPKEDDYNKDPFVWDVSEGKGNPIYNVHTYHTKVPHKAIIKFIEHYTKPGDIVFDGFCGTGMTGVAAQIIGRYAILSELSPLATFLAYNYNIPKKLKEFKKSALKILENFKSDLGWMYKTEHSMKEQKILDSYIKEEKIDTGDINYVIWTDVVICSYCGNEINVYKNTTTRDSIILEKNNECPDCSSEIENAERAKKEKIDYVSKKKKLQSKQAPILINYSYKNRKYMKVPDQNDLNTIREINEREIPYSFPIQKLPMGYNTKQPLNSHDCEYVHHFYTKRNLWSASYIYNKIMKYQDKELRNLLLFWFTALCLGQTKLNRYFEASYSQVNRYLKGTLYIGKKITEVNPIYSHSNKINLISKNLSFNKTKVIISTNSATNINLENDSVDYIFTDPPFGGNIMYSELNFIWESWLGVRTNNNKEAIINKFQNKELEDYKNLMILSFKEFYRILKPNRWITVVFHNSKAAVWNAIQEAMNKAGFIIAQVTTMDKKQKTFKQMTAPGSTKNDLIINAYRPKTSFAKNFIKNAGEGMEMDFVNQQLMHLPVKPNIERTEKMLYSKMLAHYIENGFKISNNSTDFYNLLYENFVEFDGYWFLTNQTNEYNKWKSGLNIEQLKEIRDGQKSLFISDEKSAIVWLYFFLDEPKDYNKIFTAYQKVIMKSRDDIPEPRVLLDNNFIFEDDKYRRPLNKEEKQRINESREKELNKEFNLLLKRAKDQKGKIKTIRLEALLYGFTKLYKEERYEEILIVANQLYNTTLESFGEIMDFVDIAKLKTEG